MAMQDLAGARETARGDGMRRVAPVTVIVVFGILYAAQGFTASLAQFVLPSVLREKGVSLAQIGLTYLLFAPLVLKPLWAPALDAWSRGRPARRMTVIYGCQIALVVVFLAAAFVAPAGMHAGWMAAALFLVMIVVASQDISTDALAIEAVPDSRRGIAGSTQVAGVYLGYVLGTSAWLPFYGAYGWFAAMIALAASLALMTSVVRGFSKELVAPAMSAPRQGAPSLLAALRRPQIIAGIGFLVVYQLGGRLAASLLGPFMIDAGLSLATVSWVAGVGTMIAGLCGALVGPLILRVVEVNRFLCLFALLHALCAAGFFAVAFGKPAGATEIVIVLVMLESVLFALAYVGLFVKMMSWCSADQAGTDFSLLQGADSALAIAAGLGAGVMAQAIGYAAVFAIAAVLLVAAGIAAFAFGRSAPGAASASRDGEFQDAKFHDV